MGRYEPDTEPADRPRIYTHQLILLPHSSAAEGIDSTASPGRPLTGRGAGWGIARENGPRPVVVPGGPVSVSPAAGAVRNPDLLGIYCNDHLAASTGGIELVSRMLGVHRGSSYEPHLEQLLNELREEKAALRSMMAALGIPVRQYKQLASWVGEKLARAKLNGRLLSRSPLSDVVELEFIATAVLAKRAGFETLREVAEADDRIDAALLERLINQADRQHEWLSEARREVAAKVFGGRPEPASEAAGR